MTAGQLSDLPVAALVALGVVAVAQLTVQVVALVRLFRTRPDRLVLGSRWPWLAIILLGNLVGAVLFLVLGRTPAPAPERTGRHTADDRAIADRTVQLLYGAASLDGGPASPAIETTSLTKRYGATAALDGLDLQVPEGSVFGLLGRNGAGKTTTLRILLGLAAPTSGSAHIFGRDVTHAPDVRGNIGFLPDVPGYYPWMTGRETLVFCGRLFGLSPGVLDERAEQLLDLAGLSDEDRPVSGYSRGMRQRLGIAQALVNAPRALLLDEPTSALDPLGRKEILEMVGSLRGRTTVFFSTHILGDVERVCDAVAIIDAGRVVAQAPLEELKARYAGQRGFVVQVTERASSLRQALAAEPWVAGIEPTQLDGIPALLVRASDTAAGQRRMPQLVAELEIGLVHLEPVEPSLEDVFVRLVGGAR
jgi:ABC-2 type transport system ATP-binding protein